MPLKSLILFCALCLLTATVTTAQPDFTVDISNDNFPLISNHLKLGTHTNAKGETLDANSLYFIKNGKPWFPVMGEFHFSRYPKQQWEESILKMKAAGIDVIATYIFWIYHEEEESKWNWEGNDDLRYFASLCAKHHVFLFARIGPWCHGEVRNGGFPDWLLKQSKTRSNDSAYLGYVTKFFAQIHQQLKGFYFKDGGPIIGAQMENEFRFNNPKGQAHILTLKKIATSAGIDVPYYTATGWPGSDIKQTELVPVWGGYPEAPWDKRTTKLPLSENYSFGPLRSDPTIGNDLLGTHADTTNYSGYRYPYATAEMGGGIQITYHRRPIIEPVDVTALAYTKTGSGANLMGYYMFHGGSNAIGKLSTLQESKATKYPNDYPIINYDFQSPIGEWGQLRPSYRSFKIFHSFLNNFGERLATYHAFFPNQKASGPADSQTLRWSVRAADGKGFVFISNFQRQLKMKPMENVQLQIKMKDGKTLNIPEQPVTIPPDAQIIWPFNLDLAGVNLQYATAQPLCQLSINNQKTFVFFAHDNIPAEFVFDNKNLAGINMAGGSFEKRAGSYKIEVEKPGTNASVTLKLKTGASISIIILTQQQALDAWKLNTGGKENLVISSADIIAGENSLKLQSTGKALVDLWLLGKNTNLGFAKQKAVTVKPDGAFTHYALSFTPANLAVKWAENNSFNLQPATAYDTTVANLPLYGTTLKPIAGAAYWDISIPKDALKNLSNAFLEMNYEGDTQATYFNGKLVADDFYSGVPAMIGLNQLPEEILGKKLTVLITSLSDSSKIYFEKGIREPLTGKQVATLKSVKLIPQYETVVSGF